MTDSKSYNVITSGSILSEFKPEDVCESFSELFNIPLEKAADIVGSKRILKKGLSRDHAHAYKSKLEGIGVDVLVTEAAKENVTNAVKSAVKEPAKDIATKTQSPVPVDPASALSLSSLALIPTEEDPPNPADSRSHDATSKAIAVALITCPKCFFEQTTSEQCVGCGVYFSKLEAFDDQGAEEENADGSTASAPARSLSKDKTPLYMEYKADALPVKALAAGLVAALFGAVVWKAIVIATGMELGLVAWGIGALTGYTGYLFGCHGNRAGVLCAVLALVAIFGGRYWAITSMTNDWQILAKTAGLDEEVFTELYQEETLVASDFAATIISEDDLPVFIASNNYSFSVDPEEVTAEEIDDFKQYIEPRLQALAAGEMSQEEWWQDTLDLVNEDYTTFDMFKDSFGLIDLLFIFLGVGTAYRLGRGRDDV